ncbi:MAG TPA: ubiquinol-cytochrome c reductase iron-sulfur subunit [Planctomycetota bacterium]
MAEPPKDVQKPVPQRYELVADYPPKPVTRRNFMMSWAGAAWGSFALAGGAGSMAMLRFMLPNVLFEAPQQFKAGKLEDYEFDKPDERYKQDKKAWIVKLTKDFDGKKKLIALDITCTHLGCTPNVLFSDQKYKCPCHGSGFRFTGINFEGPAPRPLERYKVYLDAATGEIVVDKNKKFQYEKGQWEDKESYIELA